MIRGVLAALLTLTLAACGLAEARTESFVEAGDVSAIAALPDGGLRYATAGGDIWDRIKKEGIAVRVAHINSSSVMGLTLDGERGTFASWVDETGAFTIGQVLPSPIRVIWKGPRVSEEYVSGRITMTPTGRVVTAVGDRLLTLDPRLAMDQRPNVISTGWSKPTALAYDQSGSLWVADTKGSRSELARAGESGPTGITTELPSNDTATALTRYGDSELAICLGRSRELRRYLIQDASRAITGRTMARDCTGDLVQMSDGRLAYVTSTGVRTTAL